MANPTTGTSPAPGMTDSDNPQPAHDHNGAELAVGNEVYIPCKIIDLGAGDQGNNLGLETVFYARGKGGQQLKIGCNSGQVVKNPA